MTCPPPYWRAGNFTRCFIDEYLLLRFPLTLLAVSALQLLWQFRGSPKTQKRGDPAVTDYYNEITTKRKVAVAASLEDLLGRKSNRAVLLTVLEGLSLAASAGVVLHDLRADTSGSLSVDLYFWSYLTVLYILRLKLPSSLEHVRRTVWQHAVSLYAFRCFIAVMILRTQHMQYDRVHASAATDLALVITAIILLIIPWASPRSLADSLTKEPGATRDPSRETYSSTLGLLSFAWVDSLLLKGWHNDRLKLEDLPTLSLVDAAASNALGFQQVRRSTSLLSRLLRHFRGLLVIQAIWASLYGVFTFVPTLLLGSLLQYVEGRSNATAEQAWYYVAFLFLASILASVAESRAIWIGQKIGFRLRSIMISEVYAKALRRRMAPSTSKGRPGVGKTAKQKSFMQRLRAWFGKSSQADEQEETSPLIEKPSQADIGTIMNLFTTDASKIADAGANMHQVWGSVPVQIIVAITLLYFTLGLSAFAGVALMAAMVPLNSRIAQRFGAIQMEIMAASDGRIQSTTEMIRSIRIIKLFAWESHFEQSIGEKRAAELRALRSRYILWSFAATIWLES